MAESMTSNQDLFMCPICLDILRDPVTIPCGHNYCMDCIKGCLDQEDQKGVYSCPQCRHTFTTRPVLYKNNVFAELVEQYRKTRSQAVVPAPVVSVAGPGEVECDICTGRKLRAVKSCLDCLLSYCETHYKAHNDLNPGRKHKVVDATGQLQERICTQHEKPLEIFCRTDQTCVCFLCMVDDHKGHDTVSASAGRKEKQTHLGGTQRKFQQRIQEREKALQELRKAVETLKSSAQTAVEDSDRIFTEMIRSIERRHSEVKELIRAKEKTEVSRAEGLLKQLEQEIAELKRRDAELEQLSHTEDHIHYLKTYKSVSDLPESKDFKSNQALSFEAVNESVSTLKGQLEDFYKDEFIKISSAVNEVQVILPSEPTTRGEFLQYSCHFTLDPNTVHRYLQLSEGNRRVEKGNILQSYPDHPERFNTLYEVLCREGVSARCYWEIERSGEWVNIAVSYKSISRKGHSAEHGFGGNDQSWRLRLTSSSSSFWHNNEETKLPLVSSSRIGVYVDHRAGTLAFYGVSDTMTLLHRVQTTFTHTLYPGFWLDHSSSVKLL
ncbi:tripartite motif-containing protein 16-like [Sardina pilchardus]|uniref:tripartite motif-containing protein 16-like n=1 Tax=Sardina pilchardus TaxID=27697 RepID=UPI002E111AE4